MWYWEHLNTSSEDLFSNSGVVVSFLLGYIAYFKFPFEKLCLIVVLTAYFKEAL